MKNIIYTICLTLKSLSLFGDKGGPKTPREFYKGQLKETKNFEHPISMFNKNRNSEFKWRSDIEIIKVELNLFNKTLLVDLPKTSLAFQMYKGLFD